MDECSLTTLIFNYSLVNSSSTYCTVPVYQIKNRDLFTGDLVFKMPFFMGASVRKYTDKLYNECLGNQSIIWWGGVVCMDGVSLARQVFTMYDCLTLYITSRIWD